MNQYPSKLPVIYIPPPPAQPLVTYVETAVSESDERDRRSFSSSQETLLEIKIGKSTRYCLTQPLSLRTSWENGQWIAWASQLGGKYQASGDTPSAAKEAWENRIHAAFQQLYGMRPFEMSTEELARWNELLSVIDVNEYKTRSPLVLREIGQVRWGALSYPSMVKWLGGRRETISLANAPADFASLKPGQWIEAIVDRDPVSGEIIQISHFERIPTIHAPTEGQMAQWASIPEAQLREDNWEW